jgi:hypothetical protein
VTCEHARQWLSDLVDERLEGDRYLEVAAHLASCADCRLELDRLRATVGALQGLERPRAPVGFVDRVVQRVRPVPWYRRLHAWLFLPLSVKLPAEAAALVVVAGLAALLWERTPELRDASGPGPTVRSAPSTAAVEPTAPVPSPTSPEPAPAETSDRLRALRALSEERRLSARVPKPEPRASHPEQVASLSPPPETKGAPETMPAPETKATPEAKAAPEVRSERESRDEPTPRPLALPGSPAAKADRSETRARSAQQTVRRMLVPVPPPADLAGRLIVGDRAAAAAAVVDLLARLGGYETGRRQDDSDIVMDVQIPAARFDDFVRGLDGLGAWAASPRPNLLPLDPPQIRLTIRLAG